MGEMKKLSMELLSCKEDALKSFYADCLIMDSCEYTVNEDFPGLLHALVDILLSTRLTDIIEIVKCSYSPLLITKANIPQFSNFDDCYFGVPNGILESGWEWAIFKKIGFLLRRSPRKEGADQKYGENHSKIAKMMGITKIEKTKGVALTDFGKYILSLDSLHRENLKSKLCFRIPLIQNYFCADMSENVITDCKTILSESTYKRRLSNIKKLISIVNTRINEELYGTTHKGVL